MHSTVAFKRGDTFLLYGVVRVADPAAPARFGNPALEEVDIASWELRSEVRLEDTLVAALVVQKRPDISPGAYLLRCDDTSGWPLSKALAFDVEYTLPTGQRVSSDTVIIECKKDVTR